MKRNYIYPVLVLLTAVIFYYAEQYLDSNTSSNTTNIPTQHSGFSYLPTSTTGAIIVHDDYSLSYAEKHEQAEWVAYELIPDHLSKHDFKRPYFIEDTQVKTVSADWRNYKKSGYDKGHLCPAADRSYTYDAFKSTFLTSNISPQKHAFNAGIWNRLEQQTRYWAKAYHGIYVVTGGVLKDGLPTIGYEHVSVPTHFYKVILDMNSKEPKMIAFLIPHQDTDTPLQEFVIPVDVLEERTGINFFNTLEDHLENTLEASKDHSLWTFFDVSKRY